ncbi:MAG: sugar ABC transporter substrate-binding protein [Clostridia bacterium]|nr:sugar ABC transporter substrate-binding protein [Clostridia bacterium]
MIEEKVEIVILQPLKEPATKDHISMLIEKNIKIVLWDYLPEEVTVDAFIAPDYVKAGQLQAQYILNQGRKVIPFVIKGDVLNIKSDKVLEGNLSILQNSPLVENLLIKEANINNTAQSHEILVEELGPNPPDVILVHDEEIALGISKILGEFKSEKKIMLFSLDINKNLLEDMVNGSLVAVDTMPNLLIQVTIDTINSLLEKGTWNYDFQINNKSALIPAKYTPVRIIDKYNFKLLEERFPALSKHEQEEKKEENQQTQNKSTKKQTKLKIKLKDGQEYEVVIPGEIEKMEIEPQKE